MNLAASTAFVACVLPTQGREWCTTVGDGTVGINDFLELLANWGPCP